MARRNIHSRPDRRNAAGARGFSPARKSKRKLDIYITELDVDDNPFADDFARRDKAVAKRYHDSWRR